LIACLVLPWYSRNDFRRHRLRQMIGGLTGFR
jgi:hypothetical protein